MAASFQQAHSYLVGSHGLSPSSTNSFSSLSQSRDSFHFVLCGKRKTFQSLFRFRSLSFFTKSVKHSERHFSGSNSVFSIPGKNRKLNFVQAAMAESSLADKEVQLEKSMAAATREMLSLRPYDPPSWASRLPDVPKEIFCLGHFPTPIHKWNLPGLPDGTEVYIKRDDLTGMQLSGNKVRKLEFLLADAKQKKADCIITIGGIQSNHCRATAVAARYAGLDSYLILRTNKALLDEDPGLVGNLLVERMVGAHISLVSKEEYVFHGSQKLGEILEAKLKAEGRRPYLIPVGGSNSLGCWGYMEAIREVEQQLMEGKTGGATGFDDIVMACGSGGTTAGLALASHLSSIKAKVHGYGVCDDPEYFYTFIQGLLDGLGCEVSSRDIVRMINAKGTGYAISTSEELELVRKFSATTGIVLDPVYSGKALKGMLEDMAENPKEWEGRRVLFIHTGGLLGMYDKVSQLQPLLSDWDRLQIPN